MSPPNRIAPRQTGSHVWRAADVADPDRWTTWLGADQVEDLIGVAVGVSAGSVADTAANVAAATDSELPEAAVTIAATVRSALVDGPGFHLVRGLPVAEIGEVRSAAVFALIGRALGSLRSQNASGDLIGHVRNVGADIADPNVRIYQTDQRQTFHTDSTDVVGLACVETAARGGDSMLVSAGAIYNAMVDRAPELAARLFDEIATDRRGEVPPGGEPFFRIPVLSWFDDRLTVIYQRQYIDSAARFDGAPRLDPEMVAALDLFDEIANEPTMHLRMALAVGDMQFVYNHALLHDRTGFVDRPNSPRHLLRVWLSLPGDRELPPIFASRYGSVTVGDRGGIVV